MWRFGTGNAEGLTCFLVSAPAPATTDRPCLALSAAAVCMQEDMGDVREQLLNQLVLLEPPSFMYAAQPPAADSRRGKRAGGAAGLRGGEAAGLEDEDGSTVFGSYAAVTMCDCRWVAWAHARMHLLKSSAEVQPSSNPQLPSCSTHCCSVLLELLRLTAAVRSELHNTPCATCAWPAAGLCKP